MFIAHIASAKMSLFCPMLILHPAQLQMGTGKSFLPIAPSALNPMKAGPSFLPIADAVSALKPDEARPLCLSIAYIACVCCRQRQSPSFCVPNTGQGRALSCLLLALSIGLYRLCLVVGKGRALYVPPACQDRALALCPFLMLPLNLLQMKAEPSLSGMKEHELKKTVMPFAQMRMKETHQLGPEVALSLSLDGLCVLSSLCRLAILLLVSLVPSFIFCSTMVAHTTSWKTLDKYQTKCQSFCSTMVAHTTSWKTLDKY